mgnify:CR=1 FL=1
MEWQKFSGGTILEQMRRMGDSVDWDRLYFTMNPKLSKVVIETFVKLYEEGLIYRGKRLVNWDPKLQSAVSDLEVEAKKLTVIFGKFATPALMALKASSLQRPVRRRFLVTKPLRFTPKTNATSRLSARC